MQTSFSGKTKNHLQFYKKIIHTKHNDVGKENRVKHWPNIIFLFFHF